MAKPTKAELRERRKRDHAAGKRKESRGLGGAGAAAAARAERAGGKGTKKARRKVQKKNSKRRSRNPDLPNSPVPDGPGPQSDSSPEQWDMPEFEFDRLHAAALAEKDASQRSSACQ